MTREYERRSRPTVPGRWYKLRYLDRKPKLVQAIGNTLTPTKYDPWVRLQELEVTDATQSSLAGIPGWSGDPLGAGDDSADADSEGGGGTMEGHVS